MYFVARADIRPEAAQAVAERFACPAVHADYHEMVRRKELDDVLLATWPNQHREQIERRLDLGVRSQLGRGGRSVKKQEGPGT